LLNEIENPYNLEGQTALITGAAGLLGVEHAMALLSIGASVVMTDVDENSLAQVHREERSQLDLDRVRLEQMDVTSSSSVLQTAEKLADEGVRVDILVNNAAVDPKVGGGSAGKDLLRLETFPVDEWERQMAVGLRGAFLCSQVFGTRMARDGGGVILNVSSDLSVIAPDQRLYRQTDLPDDRQPVKPVTYSVVKTGLVGLTRYLATYWADSGVRANALSPGGVQTEQDPEFVSRISRLIPLGRMAHRSEYRAAVQFLCSDASAYMTGQNLVIDGGRSVW
jgi:NAD(P)-dependent dehydrogenase (short-subunit alcohol dehydrogenase family)